MNTLAKALLADTPKKGWHAELKLGFKAIPHKTVLNERKRRGPLAVQRAFYPENDVCHIYLLHPPGGVVGGDRLDVTLNLTTDSHALLTTPGATKFYRSAGDYAIQVQDFNVEDGAVLEWLPQENIFFPGAKVKTELNLHLQGSAKAALWEIQCLGRPVINEVFDEGCLDNHWRIYRDGRPLLIERLRADKNKLAFLSQLNGHAVSGTFILTNVDKEVLEPLREQIVTEDHEDLAMSLIDDLLVVRYLGNSTERARSYFSEIWSQLREQCIGSTPMVPRIWNT